MGRHKYLYKKSHADNFIIRTRTYNERNKIIMMGWKDRKKRSFEEKNLCAFNVILCRSDDCRAENKMQYFTPTQDGFLP